ncbi:hypothetical protein B7L70_07435 [Vulcanisaeta sp. EB80]|uniref:hypothetical protein n=1 Tax=Vulcanisaeta sp. EB80 TaxID=1650660 RepID=UPI0009BD785A|nr:hypothetical protein [Vulcanisaeta sp. EB80]PLC67660.1 hypothetical protein B7L70_07435 [Vulcanisaeta sp. EB80]
MLFVFRALSLVVLALAIVSIAILVANSIYAVPSLTSSIRIGNFGEVNYYASQPMPNVPPGLLVRVFLINGSVVEPVRAFIDVYANAPNGIVHVAMGYSPTLIVSFNDSNWQYVLGKWASLGIPFSEYNTSMLIFITYVKGNESWIVPLVIPYNVAWAIGGTTQTTSPRYIVVNALINVNELRPNKVVPVRLNSTVTDPQVFGTVGSGSSEYVVYNCSLSGPRPKDYLSQYQFYPTSTCVGINGSLPITWATWDKGVLQSDKGLQFELNIYFSGTINWDAMATGYGNIGTSYSANENWVWSSPTYTIGSQITQPGSVYWYYGNATWAIVNYEVVYVTYRAVIQVGTTTVSEVLYVPPNDINVNPAFDYGNGTISMLYNGAITLSQQYFGYPALNASTVVDYAAFIYTSTGQEYLYQCNGPVTNASTTSGIAYAITLGGVNTAYGLSSAELGTGLGSLALGIAAMLITKVPLTYILGGGSQVLGIASLLAPPSTSTTVTSTYIEFFNVKTGTNLYISVIDASKVYGLPTFGFILNATSYYGNPTTYTCKYGKVAQIG